MSGNNYSSIEQIGSILNDAKRTDWLEASRSGKSARFQLGVLIDSILAQRVPEQNTGAYWKTIPVYAVTVPVSNPVVTIQADGVIQKGAATINPGSATLELPSVGDPTKGRFDAIVFDTDTNTYKAITGQIAASPAQPSYNTAKELLLTYVLINSEGAQYYDQPNSHEPNRDQFLDKDGPNQVSAAEIRAWIDAQQVARSVSTYAELAGLDEKQNGENVFVEDASGDATVEAGWAIYRYILSGDNFVKIAEQESIDLVLTSRDKGHFPTLADLQAAYPAPTDGALASVEEGKKIYVAQAGTFEVYNQGGGADKLQFIIYSDLDTVSPEVSLKGNNIVFTDFYKSAKLSAASIYIGLDIPSPSFTAQTTVAGLNAWVAANVPDGNTQFLVYASGTYSSGQTGNATIILEFTG